MKLNEYAIAENIKISLSEFVEDMADLGVEKQAPEFIKEKFQYLSMTKDWFEKNQYHIPAEIWNLMCETFLYLNRVLKIDKSFVEWLGMDGR